MTVKLKQLAGWTLALAALGPSAAATAASGAAGAEDGRWHFSVTPYLWLPNANGSSDLTVHGLRNAVGQDLGTLRLNAEIGPNDYLENLQAAVMLMAEARKGDWSLYTDINYVDFGNQKSHVRNVSGPLGRLSTDIYRETQASLQSTIWTLNGGYTLARGTYGYVDLLAGARYLSMDSSLSLAIQDASGRLHFADKVSMDQEVWDGIVGARGALLFPGTQWFVPYYADVGTGSSNWTWQAMLGLGYRFGWGDVTLAVRSLSYSFDKNDADLRLTGPGLGVSFRW